MAEKRQRRNVPEDYDPFGEVFSGKAPKMTPEQKAENDRRWAELMEYCKQKGQRRQKLREALLEEEKKTGMKLPFELWLRFGIASVLPEEGEPMPDTSEKPNEPPEMTYYRRFEENFMPEVRELKLP